MYRQHDEHTEGNSDNIIGLITGQMCGEVT